MSSEHPSQPHIGIGARLRSPGVRFVVVFVVIMLTLLTGYRYLIPTRANDAYLFLVATNTAWVLKHFGEYAAVEDPGRMRINPAMIRATLKAWERMAEDPTQEEINQASSAPLSPWELWRYRAESMRRSKYVGAMGPRVSFVLRADTAMRREWLQRELERIQQDSTLSEENRRKAIETVQKRLEQLENTTSTQENANSTDGRQEKAYAFHFILVPECGAIEVMAIFFAAVIAFPTRWRTRLLGALLGVPLMYCVNILRLCCLAVIGALDEGGQWFRFAHEYLWQAVYIVFVVAVWLLWVEFMVRRRAPHG